MPYMPSRCPRCNKPIDELYANILRRKNKLWHKDCWKAAAKERHDAIKGNEDRLDSIYYREGNKKWSMEAPSERRPDRLPSTCPACSKPIYELYANIVRKNGRLWHKKCYDNYLKALKDISKQLDEYFKEAGKDKKKEWTIKYGSRVIKKAGKKPKRRPYVKEVHYHEHGKPDVVVDVSYLRPIQPLEYDVKDDFHFNSIYYNIKGAGGHPWHLKLVTTEKRLAKECQNRIRRRKRFARIVTKVIYRRKWYVVYENYHKKGGTPYAELTIKQRKQIERVDYEAKVKAINDAALEKMKYDPPPGAYHGMGYRKSKKYMLSDFNGEDISKARMLENNTIEITFKDGTRIIRLHHTNIVTFKLNGDLVLNTGGWRSITTKDRINRYSPVRVWSERGTWYCGPPDPGRWHPELTPKQRRALWTHYHDGIVFRKNKSGKWREVGADGKLIPKKKPK